MVDVQPVNEFYVRGWIVTRMVGEIDLPNDEDHHDVE